MFMFVDVDVEGSKFVIVQMFTADARGAAYHPYQIASCLLNVYNDCRRMFVKINEDYYSIKTAVCRKSVIYCTTFRYHIIHCWSENSWLLLNFKSRLSLVVD